MFLSHSGARFGSFSISGKGKVRFTILPLLGKLTACIFVRTIITILVAITEKTLVDADGISTCKLSDLTERLICAEQRLNFSLLGQLVTVLHSPLPVARLLLQVKGKARGASDGLQALEKDFMKSVP